MNLLDLPADILIEIFRWLDANSLHSCLSVSKCLRGFLIANPEFEYRYRLEQQGMINQYDGRYTYANRVLALKQLTHFWRASGIKRLPTQTYNVEGACIAYELVAGVFAKTDGFTLTLQQLPTFSRPAMQVIRSPEELRILIKDFALDPTQDLIVFLEADNLPNFALQDRQLNIHPRTLSTNIPHPEAHKPVIQFNIPYHPRGNDLSAATIQLAADLLSLFFPSGSGHLLLWDWKSGTLILNSATSSLPLPPGASSFELLGSRSYAIFSTESSGSIYIYNIDYPRNPVLPPFCVARLNFPELLPGIRLSSIQSHTSPFLGRPRHDGIFTTDPESRVYVISIRFLNSRITHATFFIDHSAFVPYTHLRDTVAEDLDVPWETWCRYKFFFSPMRVTSSWLRYVQGTRVLIPLEHEHWSISILDFNINHTSPEDRVTNDLNIYRHSLNHSRSPKRWELAFNTTCSSFMIDEDYVLGLQTFGTLEDKIRRLEFFSMYPTRRII